MSRGVKVGVWQSARARARADALTHGRSRFNEAGDTLVEVLLALIVLGLASVALLIAFSTSISASAEHRQLATSDIVLSAVSQQAIASINSQLNLFTTCQTLSYFQTNVQMSVPSPYNSSYTVQLTNVQYWNPTLATFGSACNSLGPFGPQPEEITVTVTDNGKTYTNSFVVDYPLAGATTQSDAGTAAQLVWSTPPSLSASTSVPFTQQPVLEIEDSNGNAVTTDLSPVIISIESGSSGELSGCAGSESAGFVTFSGCELDKAGTYTLMATDGNLSTTLVSDPTITVTGSTTPYLVFTTEPKGGQSGFALSPEPTITVEVGGVPDVAWPTGTINLSVSGGVWPSACDKVTVTLGVAVVPSSCTFEGSIFYDPVSNETLAVPYTMSASGNGLIPATSTSFSVTLAGAATQLVYAAQPSGVSAATAATPFSTQPIVDIEDAFGNVVTSSSATVSLSLDSNSFNAGLQNCSSTTTKGVATFSGCELTKFGTGFTLEASASSLSLTPIYYQSTAFNVTGLASYMVFTKQPAAGVSGSTLPIQPIITIYDSNNYVVTASTTPLTLTASGGTLTLCTNLTPYQGVVTVATCNFAGIVGTNYTLTATQGSISVTSNPISPTAAGTPTQLAFTTEPVAGAAGSPLLTQPIVKVEDSAGNVALTSSATITLATTPGTGTLANCADVQAVSGVVNASGCTFGGVIGTQYTMTATSANLTQATSSNFSVTGPGPIDQIVLSGCASSIWWGASCTVTAAADDAWGNLATSYSGGLDGFTFAQTGGSGAVTGLTTVTALNGVASDTVTGSVVGTLQVNATDPTAPSVASSTLTITVVGIPQTVAFYTDNTYSTVITTGTTTYLAAGTYATYAQGSGSGTITFASLTPSICSVNSSSGLVALLGAGTCNLTADAGATPHYADSGTTTFALTINRGTNAITVTSPAPGSASVGGATYTPTATATSGDTVVITSATTSVCTISSGKVSFLIVGSCTLNFNDVGNTNYLAAPQVQQTFAIAQGANNITITSTAPGSAVVGGATYTPTATATSGDTVAITSGSTSVCTITGGVVSFVTAGSCSIDFNDAGNTNYLAAPQAVQTFSVGKGANAITITSTAPNPGVGPIGPTYTPTATATSGDTVVITSATTPVCTVTAGVVSFVTNGTCTLDFNDVGNANYVAAAQVVQTFSVKHSNAITITSTAPGSPVVGGATYHATATATSSDAVVITSGTTSVCTVASGIVSFVTAGTCTLDFNDVGNATYVAAVQATQTFTVGQGANTITVTSTAPGAAVVSGATYHATATATSGDAVVITSGTTGVCTVSSGIVTFVGAGSCSIDFNDAGNTNYVAAAQVVQTFNVGRGANTITITSTAPNPGVAPSGATYTPTATATSGDTVVVTSSTTGVCTVTGGVVSFVTYGTCTLDFNDAGNGNYVAATQQVQTVSVKHTNAITITSTAPGSAVVGGATYTPTATATSSDTVSITSATPSVCTFNGFVATFVASGSCTLDFNDVGNTNYVAAGQAVQTFTVGQGANAITVTSTAPNPARAGSTYTATATATSGDTVVITSATTTICSVSGNTVTLIKIGTCTLDFNDAGNGNYVAATQQVQTFTVVVGFGYLGGNLSADTSNTVATSAALTAPLNTSMLIMVSDYGSVAQTCTAPTGGAIGAVTVTLLSNATSWYSAGGAFYGMCVYSAEATGNTSTVTETMAATTSEMAIQVFDVLGDTAATFSLPGAASGNSAAPAFTLSGAPAAGTSEVLFGDTTNNSTTLASTWTNNTPTGFTQAATPEVQTWGTFGNARSFDAAVSFGTSSTQTLTGAISALSRWGTIAIEVIQ